MPVIGILDLFTGPKGTPYALLYFPILFGPHTSVWAFPTDLSPSSLILAPEASYLPLTPFNMHVSMICFLVPEFLCDSFS